MNLLAMLLGTMRYEFRMQIRRPAVWITFLCIALLMLVRRGALWDELMGNAYNLSLLERIVLWTYSINFICPIAVAVLLADRLPRDRKTKVDELLTTTPGTLSGRLMGKYLGSMLATLVPVLLFYCMGIGCLLYSSQDPMVLPLALATFAVIVLPGILFVSAFSIACPAVMWVPLYQFLFVGYWFWGNLLSPTNGIPTLSRTILTPIGSYTISGIFGVNDILIQDATPLQAIESILLLVGTAILVMFVVWSLLRWQQARQ